MEIGNTLTATEHGCAFMDLKRYSKCSELDNGSMGDFFGIDDLLDFSNADIGGPIGEGGCTGGSQSTPLETVRDNSSVTDGKCFDALNTLISTAPDDLCIPCDDVAELEWLSNFVEESFSSRDASTNAYSPTFTTTHGERNNVRAGNQKFQRPSPVSILESNACSPETANFGTEMTIPGRVRSKRSRTVLCIWNTHILSAGDASANILESSSTSTITTTATQWRESDTFSYEQSGANSLPSNKIKNSQHRPKKLQDTAQTRRCQHCGTQRTPQWRAGPLGPKTLCNACGVRYKSGRLLPEYRPAASPTFMEAIHSNSHKKVLEMRRQKEEEIYIGEEEDEEQEQYERNDEFLLENHSACNDSV